MSDQFFIDEDEQQPAAVPAKEQPKAAPAKPAKQKGGIKPPTFGMAVAISAVSLVLGLGIGFFSGMYLASNSSSTQDQASAHSQTAASDEVQAEGTQSDEVESSATVVTSVSRTDSSASSEEELPSGHPDMSQFTNEDGSINMEAVEEYRTEHAGEASDETADETKSE